MNHPLICQKCDRQIEWRLNENKGPGAGTRWVAWDKITKKKHGQSCYKGIGRFKLYDKVIAFWLKDTVLYVIGRVDNEKVEYRMIETWGSHQTKDIDFVTADRYCKLMDKIYEYLYD